jgi:hypothetical protein
VKKRVILAMVLLCAVIAVPLLGCSPKVEPKQPLVSFEQRQRALEIAAELRAGGTSPTTTETYSAGLREEYTGGNVYLVDVQGYLGIEVTLQTNNDYVDSPVLIEALVPTGTIEIAVGIIAPYTGWDWRIVRPGNENHDWDIMVLSGTWQRITNNEDVVLVCYITSSYESIGNSGQNPTISTSERNTGTVDFIVVYDYGSNGIRLMTMEGKNFLSEMGYYNDVLDKTDFMLKNVSDTYSHIFQVFERDDNGRLIQP